MAATLVAALLDGVANGMAWAYSSMLVSGLDLSAEPRQTASLPLVDDASSPTTSSVQDLEDTKTGDHSRLLPVLLRRRGANDWTQVYAKGINQEYDSYLDFKKHITDHYNFDFYIDFSFFAQFGNNGHPVWIAVYYPGFTWRPFIDTVIGSGEIDFTTGFQNYFGRSNTQQAAELGLISVANDWMVNDFAWSTLTYTHTFPGYLNWLSISGGSYNLTSFDPSLYAANAQTTFISYSFAQDAAQTFPNAGVGGYVKVKPSDQFFIVGGVQDGTNLTGSSLSTYGYETDRLLGWGNLQWTPKFARLGDGVYSLLIYDQPAVPRVTSQSTGVSFSASQELSNKWGLWARVNNATGTQIPIRTSYDAGGIMNDPFGRDSSDQIGTGLGWDKTNFQNTSSKRRGGEWVSEIYYRYQLVKPMSLTPDLQVFWNPALSPGSGPVAVFTIRTTLSF